MDYENQEIDFSDLARILASKWWLILVLTLVASITALSVTQTMITPVYQASTTVFIGKESAKITDISLMDIQVGSQLVTDYSELIRTNLVLDQVIAELSLKAKPRDLRSNLSVRTLKDSRFMEISYRDTNPEMAVKAVNMISDILKLKAEEVVGVKNVVIVDYALKPQVPVSPVPSRNILVAGTLGALLAVAIIFIQMMLDNTLKKETDIEKELGLPVLGMIPRFKGEVR